MRPLLFGLLFVSLLACGDTGQRELYYPVTAKGEAPAPFAATNGWQVTLSRADIALGPVYFCATTAASSSLCPAPVSEISRVVLINGIDPQPQALGDAYGTTGTVGSVMFDYGINWFATQSRIKPSAVAPIGSDDAGHSAVFAGTATNGTTTLAFTASVDKNPQFQGEWAVQGMRVSAQLNDETQLELSALPSTWLSSLDFNALAPAAVNGTLEIVSSPPVSADGGTVVAPSVTSRAADNITFEMGSKSVRMDFR